MAVTADIIDANLELMLSKKKCGMLYLLEIESVGARGQFEIEGKMYSLMATNFYYDGDTGQILCFSNREEALEDKARGTFRIAVDFKLAHPYVRIIDFISDKNTSKQANRTIKNCIKLYNDTYETIREKVM